MSAQFRLKTIIMIQRIQTLYLLLAAALLVLSMVLPVAFYSNLVQGVQFDYSILEFLKPQVVVYQKFNSLPMFMFGTVTLLLAVISIFVYKKRTVQYRICLINTILIIFYIGVIAYFFYIVSGENNIRLSYKIPIVFPIVALVFNILAMSGIRKDEKLVKSLDRLR